MLAPDDFLLPKKIIKMIWAQEWRSRLVKALGARQELACSLYLIGYTKVRCVVYMTVNVSSMVQIWYHYESLEFENATGNVYWQHLDRVDKV